MMNLTLSVTILVLSNFFSFKINASILKSIYGEDNRRLVRDLDINDPKDIIYLTYSRSILAQIPNWRITNEDNENISIKTKNLKEGLNYCPTERFLEEPIVSSCTAFLIGEDEIMTAGHCVKDKFDCKNNIWVLDYTNDDEHKFALENSIFSKSKIFHCKELIAKYENNKYDYAVIKLDKLIEDRLILKTRTSGKVDNKEPLFLLGHPLGMPLMVADNISIRDNSQEYFIKLSADAFSGNSGSPIIGINSGLVEGILIRGDEDYTLNNKLNCYESYKCRDNECRGETAQRLHNLPIKK